MVNNRLASLEKQQASLPAQVLVRVGFAVTQ
jgi:hypothetical protein